MIVMSDNYNFINNHKRVRNAKVPNPFGLDFDIFFIEKLKLFAKLHIFAV